MPDPQKIQLDDGTFAIIPQGYTPSPEEMQALQSKMAHTPDNMLLMNSFKNVRPPQQTADNLLTDASKRLGGAALNGIPSLLHGDIPGAALGGTMGAIFPPETKGEAAGQAAMALAPLGTEAKALSKLPWFARMLGNAGFGAGHFAGSEIARQALDNPKDQPINISGMGAGLSGILSGFMGAGASRVKKAPPGVMREVGPEIENELGNRFQTSTNEIAGGGLGSKSAEPLQQMGKDAQTQMQSDVANMMAQKSLVTTKMRNSIIAKKEIEQLNQSRDIAIDKAEQKIRADGINLKRQVADLQTDYKGVKKYGIDPNTGKSFLEGIPQTPIDYKSTIAQTLKDKQLDPNQVQAATYFIDELVKQGMSPSAAAKLVSQGTLKGDVTKSIADAISKQDLAADFTRRKAAGAAQTQAMKDIEDKIAQTNDHIKQNQLKVLHRNSVAVQGVAADPSLRASVQNSEALEKRALQLGVDMEKRRAERQTLEEAIRSRKENGLFNNPVLDYMLGPASKQEGQATTDSIADRLVNASHEQIRDLMGELKDPAMQGAARNTYLLEVLGRSYDQKKGFFDVDKMQQLTNRTKLTEVFGGGQNGVAAAEQFGKFMQALETFQQASQRNQDIMKGGLQRAIRADAMGLATALATGLVFHYPTMAKVAAGATLIHLPLNERFITYMMNKPGLGDQMYKWAQTGGSATALRAYPAVSELFKDATKIDANNNGKSDSMAATPSPKK